MASCTRRPQSIDITLTPIDDPAGKRIITLAVNKPIIIGRSSRSEPKNLAAGLNNALFENPVVSRKHAHLELKMSAYAVNGKDVWITDVGSMHGTCVNGEKLHKDAAFKLQSGDEIKFGDKVLRHTDAHDGLTVSVDIAETSSSNAALQIKSFTGSYKVPSDSDYDSDGSDYSHDEPHDSSTKTTPEQSNAKPGSQESPIDVEKPLSGGFRGVKPVSGSFREVIDLASDDGHDEPIQPSKIRFNPETTIVQDSYEEQSLRVADPYVDPWQTRTVEKEAERDDVENIVEHNTGLAYMLGTGLDGEVEDDMADGSDDDDDVESDDFLDDHSDVPFMSDDDDDDLSASDASDLADEGSASEDEGPEVLSSKRQISPELGTLGETDDAANASYTYSATKLHYDPVRGSQPPSPVQVATASKNADDISSARPRTYASFQSSVPAFDDMPTDYDGSSRWDVPPLTSQYYGQGPYNYTSGYQAHPYEPTTTHLSKAPPFSDWNAVIAGPQVFCNDPFQPISTKPASKIDIMDLVEDRAAMIQERIAPTMRKRKADAMVEEETIDVTYPGSVFEDQMTTQPAPITVQNELEHIAQEIIDAAPDTESAIPESQEPPKKKIKRAIGVNKIFFPTKEIAKAAGYMALGGAATIGFLVSDAAERLFS